MPQSAIEADRLRIQAVAKTTEAMLMFWKPYRMETVETWDRIATTRNSSPGNYGNNS